jgi:hypothetical protein
VLIKASAFMDKYTSDGKVATILYDCPADAKFLSEEILKKRIPIFNCSTLFLNYINLRNVFPIELTGGIANMSLSHALEVLDM